MTTAITEEQRQRLAELIPPSRAAAAEVGTMHSDWDAIFDAEALLAGGQTLLRGTPAEVADKVIAMLDRPKS